MGKMATDRSQCAPVDAILRDEMARSNRALRSLAPVIAQMLDSDGPSLVTDAIVARLRGMMSDIARQLLAVAVIEGSDAHSTQDAKAQLVASFSSDEPLIDHLYAVALEGVLIEGLEKRASIDPVLSPLMQELIASKNPEVAQLAVAALAAQSRFTRNVGRMTHPIGELPQEILASVLDHLHNLEPKLSKPQIAKAIAKTKGEFDEGLGRIGLLARLCSTMHGGAIAALDLNHSGLALFVSAASSLTRTPRDSVVFACHEGQSVRLALILLAAGLTGERVEAQTSLLGARFALPSQIVGLSAADAVSALREMGGV